jgi:hypothetical protein
MKEHRSKACPIALPFTLVGNTRNPILKRSMKYTCTNYSYQNTLSAQKIKGDGGT